MWKLEIKLDFGLGTNFKAFGIGRPTINQGHATVYMEKYSAFINP